MIQNMQTQPADLSTQALQPVPAGGLELHTDWSDPWDGSAPDAERHRQFAAYALEVAMQERPLLISFLARLGAMVAARPHGFSYKLIDEGSWVYVPEIASQLVLLPWVDAHETAH